ADRVVSFGGRGAARPGRRLAWPLRISFRGGEVMRRIFVLAACACVLTACSDPGDPPQYGANPNLPEPRRGLLPDMRIALPAAWDGELPAVPEGFAISAIATDLM